MKVKELIAKLQEFDQEAGISYLDWQGGRHSIGDVCQCKNEVIISYFDPNQTYEELL